jgi:hypothetical protein
MVFVAEVRVQRVTGAAEVLRAGTETWQPLVAGQTLSKADSVRTLDGTAELLTNGTTSSVVELMPGTDVTVEELTADLTRYLLGSGLVTGRAGDANDSAAKANLQVAVKSTDVLVQSAGGKFNVSSNGSGTVAVGAAAGNVTVSSLGRAVVLKAGERTLVAPGRPPDQPQPLATSLLLKVAWPSDRETNKRRVTVTGRTAAGALVFAVGRPIAVGADGTFSATVRLSEGDNLLNARAVDVSGNVTRQDGPRVHVDSKGAATRFDTEKLWSK